MFNLIICADKSQRKFIQTVFCWCKFLRLQKWDNSENRVKALFNFIIENDTHDKPLMCIAEDYPQSILEALQKSELRSLVKIYCPIELTPERSVPIDYFGSIEHIAVEIVKTDRSEHYVPPLDSIHKKFCVYYLYEVGVGIKNVRYVGKCTYDPVGDTYSRIFRHEHTRPSSPLFQEISAKGMTMDSEIVATFDVEADAHHAEVDHIKLQRDKGANLYNKTSGGDSGWTLCDSARKKMSESRIGHLKGIPLKPEHKVKLSEAAKISHNKLEWKANHSLKMTGKKYGPISEEKRKNISKSLIGRVMETSQKQAMKTACKNRTFIQVNVSHNGVPIYAVPGQKVSDVYPYMKNNGQGSKFAIEECSKKVVELLGPGEISYSIVQEMPRDEFREYWYSKWPQSKSLYARKIQ